MYDGARNVLQQLDSFDANLNIQKHKLEFSRKLDSRDANLNSTERKLESLCLREFKFVLKESSCVSKESVLHRKNQVAINRCDLSFVVHGRWDAF